MTRKSGVQRYGKGPEAPQPKSKQKTFRKQGNDPADWAGCEPQLVLDCIAKMTAQGGALRFGYTSDGGAYALGIYNGDDIHTEYVRPGEDINQVLREFLAWLDSD